MVVYFHFLGFKPSNLSDGKSIVLAAGLLKEAERLIRLKHYSYSRERTYLQWIRRFFEYTKQTGEKVNAEALNAEDCKNFLSHLALKERVSASPLDDLLAETKKRVE